MHYKHDLPKARVRARCGHCDAELSVPRLSAYRIVSMEHALAIGPSAQSAKALAARPHDIWQEDDPLPQIPEMAPTGAYGSSLSQPGAGEVLQDDGDAALEAPSSIGGSSTTFALWMAAGAIAGTAASWTVDGATVTGMAAGTALGAVAGWGWLRWTSSK